MRTKFDFNSDHPLIAPSLLAADLSNLESESEKALNSGADILHYDVMDNHFVPNLTFGTSICKSIIENTNAPIDVHLMTFNVDRMIESFASLNSPKSQNIKMISFHPEATHHIDRSLSLINSYDVKAGLALNPTTPLNCLEYVLNKLDFVVLMSVNPGFSGQKFIPTTFSKLQNLRLLLDNYQSESGRKILIEIDGGVCLDNAGKLTSLGGNILVIGTAFFSTENYHQTMENYRHMTKAESNR